MQQSSKLSQFVWITASASAFAFVVLVVFASPDGEITSFGLAAFGLSALLVVALTLARPGEETPSWPRRHRPRARRHALH